MKKVKRNKTDNNKNKALNRIIKQRQKSKIITQKKTKKEKRVNEKNSPRK